MPVIVPVESTVTLAVAVVPLPPGAAIVAVAVGPQPEPPVATATDAMPKESVAVADACWAPAPPVGAAMITDGGLVYPAPPAFTNTVLTDVVAIPRPRVVVAPVVALPHVPAVQVGVVPSVV
jgi:hypothetical protein